MALSSGSINFTVWAAPAPASGNLNLFLEASEYAISTGGLVAYWRLEEPSGIRFDSVGTNHLNPSGNPLGVLGKIDTGCEFVRSNRQRLLIEDNANLSSNDEDFTIALWTKLNSVDGNYHILVNKWNENITSKEYRIIYDPTVSRFSFWLSSSGSDMRIIDATNFGAPSINQWYSIVCWHDSINNRRGIAVNDVTNESSYTLGTFDGTSEFEIGGNSSVTVTVTGSIPTQNPLVSGLISHWKLDEAAGSGYDAFGSNHLSQSNNPTGVPAILDSGRRFSAAGTQSLFIADNTDLSAGDTDFTVTAWANFTSLSTWRPIVTKYNASASNRCEYRFTYNINLNRISATFSPDGTDSSSTTIAANNLGAPSTNTWYFCRFWHDSVNNRIGIQVNDLPPETGVYTGGVFDSTESFQIGSESSAPIWMDGRIDAVSFYRRVLTSGEHAQLYNAGEGLQFPYPSGSSPTTTVVGTSGIFSDCVIDEVGFWKRVLTPAERTNFYNDGLGLTYPLIDLTPRASGGINLYLLGPDMAVVSGSINLTLDGVANTINNYVDFYLANSGVNNFLYLYTRGSGIGEGLYPFNDFINLYIQRDEAAILNMFCYGGPNATGSLDLFLHGVNYIDTLSSYEITIPSSFLIPCTGSSDIVTCVTTIINSSGTLASGLISYWKLDEPSGTRLDSHGSNHLTSTNNPLATGGILNNAARFVHANSQGLSRTDNADLSTGDIDFTITAWVYLEDKTSFRPIVSKWNEGTSSREYRLFYSQITDRLRFGVSGDGVNTTFVSAGSHSPVPNRWYFVRGWHDATNNEIGIEVPDSGRFTASHTAGVFSGTADFEIGHEPAQAAWMTGRIDEVGFWKRLLTSGEFLSLWNNGAGSGYPFNVYASSTVCTTGNFDLTGLVAHWKLQESGNARRLDSFGNHHLYSWNNPTAVPAIVGSGNRFNNGLMQRLYLPHASGGSDFSPGSGTSFTITCWTYIDDVVTWRPFVAKYNNATSQQEYRLAYSLTETKLRWTMSYDGDNTTGLNYTNYPGSPTGVWLFIRCWYDRPGQLIGMQVNNSGIQTTPWTHISGVYQTQEPFEIGGEISNAIWHLGMIDEVTYWNRLLTETEHNHLYNSGLGREYPWGSGTCVDTSGTVDVVIGTGQLAGILLSIPQVLGELATDDSTKLKLYSHGF